MMEKNSGQKKICRKDMQCTCPMCLASFQATWDLRRPLPPNSAFQTITNLEGTFIDDYRTPPRFRTGKENDSPKSTGHDEKVCRPVTPFFPGHDEKVCRPLTPFLPPSRSNLSFEKSPGEPVNQPSPKTTVKSKRRMLVKSFSFLVCLLLLFMIPNAMMKAYPPALSSELVGEIAKESQVRMRLADQLDLIQRRLRQSLPGQTVINCTGSTAPWTLKDAGSLLHSECTIFSSGAESVSLWGYPLATTGILGRGVRNLSLTVISGRVFEWREGRAEYDIHEKGDNWTLPQWAASSIHLEANTWLLEYKKSFFSGLGTSSGIYDFIKHKMRALLSTMKGTIDSTTLAYRGVTERSSPKIQPT